MIPDRSAAGAPTTEPAYDHSKIVAQFVVDGRSVPLTDDEAWDLAWKLIGFCVEHRRARAEAGT